MFDYQTMRVIWVAKVNKIHNLAKTGKALPFCRVLSLATQGRAILTGDVSDALSGGKDEKDVR